MLYIALAIISALSWLISTVGAGGGALMMMPVVAYLLGAQAVAPVVTLGTLMGAPARVYLFWHAIDWRVVRWYVPGVMIGSLLGAWALAKTLQYSPDWIQLLLGLFLVSTVFQLRLEKSKSRFTMKLGYFLPLGFSVGFVSGLLGGVGPVMNPFFLNYKMPKESIIATKAVNAFVMHLFKMIGYAGFSVVTMEHIGFGLAIGVGAILGTWLGKRYLKKISESRFRKIVVAIMVISGLHMIWEQRAYLLFWLP
jgi:uncharacterized membrane protein YfcA